MPDSPQPVARPVHPKEMEQPVSIREFEQRISSMELAHNLQVSHVREVALEKAAALEKALELQAHMNEKALTLQAKEYERRLEELNHSHKNAMENWARTLPRELFEQFEKSTDEWKRSVDAALIITQGHPTELSEIDKRVHKLETSANKVTGALILIGLMGATGVIAFGMALLRVARQGI